MRRLRFLRPLCSVHHTLVDCDEQPQRGQGDVSHMGGSLGCARLFDPLCWRYSCLCVCAAVSCRQERRVAPKGEARHRVFVGIVSSALPVDAVESASNGTSHGAERRVKYVSPGECALTVDGVGGGWSFPCTAIDRVAEQSTGRTAGSCTKPCRTAVGSAPTDAGNWSGCIGLIRLVGGLAEGSTAKVKQRMSPIVVFGVFALFYLVFLTVAKSLTIVDDHARHYAPAYIAFLLMAVVSADRLLKAAIGSY